MTTDFESTRVKGERGGILNARQYNIMLAYMKTGVLPSLKTLMEANMVDNYYTKHGSGRGRFRSWANRMYLRQSDGHLVHKTTGKIVIPREEWEPTIMAVHSGVASSKEKGHLSFRATYSKIQKKYSMGKQRFGMSEDLVKNVVKSCTTGSCLLKKITEKIDDSDDEYSLKPLLEGLVGTENEKPFLLHDLQLPPTTTATITTPDDSTTPAAPCSLPQLCGPQPHVAVNSSNTAGHIYSGKSVTAEDDVCIQSSLNSSFVSNGEQTFGHFPSCAHPCPQNLNVNSNIAKYMTLPVLIRAPTTMHGISGVENADQKEGINQSLKALPKLSCNLPRLCNVSAPSASDCGQPFVMPSTNSSAILPMPVTPFTQTPPVVSYPHVRQRFQSGHCDLVTKPLSGNFYLHHEEKPESATTSNINSTDFATITLCVIPIQPESNEIAAQNTALNKQLQTQPHVNPSTASEQLSTSCMQVDGNQPIICSVGSIDQAVWEATSPSSIKTCSKSVNKIKDKLQKKLKKSLPPEQFRNCTVKEMLIKKRENLRKSGKSFAKSKTDGRCESKSLYDKGISKRSSIGLLKKEQTEKMKDLLLKSLHKVKKKKGKRMKKISDMKNMCQSVQENLNMVTIQEHISDVNENALNRKKLEPTNTTGPTLKVPTAHSNALETITNPALITKNHASVSSVMATYTVQANSMEKEGTPVFRMSVPLLTQSTNEHCLKNPLVTDSQQSTVPTKPVVTRITFPVIQAFPASTQVVPSTSSTVSSVAYARVVTSQGMMSAVTKLSSSTSLYTQPATQTTVLQVVPPVSQSSLSKCEVVSPMSETIPKTIHSSMEIDSETVEVAVAKTQAEVPLSPGIQNMRTTCKTTPIKWNNNRSVTSSSMKTTPIKKRLGIAPYPDTPPYPQIWHHFDDVRKEKHCYNRLIRVVQDMRMDVMKSVMKDKPAADRLKKKIAYGELLVQQYRSFLSSKTPR